MMIGLLSVLQPDLRNLSMEAKKKNLTALKESAERAIMRLRSIEDQKDTINSHAKYIEAISKSEDVVKPFLQACETKNTKMIIIAVGSIQKLISHNAVASHVLPNVINVLAPLLDMGDDTVQLKVLQTMLTLLTTSNELHGHALAQALGLCFRLHDSKLPSVHHTASATLRQAVAVLFDRTFTEMINDEQGNERKMRAENDTQDQSRPILAPYATDAYLFLQDLCTLTGGDPPAWLPTDHVSRTLGLELIESVLNTHHQLFLDIHEFSVLLKDRVCPLVIKSFKLSTAFPYVVRLYRILNIFIKNFSGLLVAECEVFLSRPIRILEASDSPLWLSTLALEVLKDICNDTDLMKTLYLQNDGRGSENDQPQTNIFQSITNALSTFLHFLFRQDPDVAIKVISIKNKCLDMLTFSEAPAIPLTYPILIALECLAGIVESVGYLAFSNEKQMCIQFANNSWDAMKNLLGIILSKTTDEQLTQNILNVYQSFGNTCATLNLAEPRNAILTSLARQALPAPKEGVEQGDSGITMRHIITLRTIVNIAHKMGDVLESSWGICLEVFDGLDRIIKSTNPIQSLQESGLSYIPAKGHLAAELNSLSASISDIFKNSSKLQNPAIDYILKSLCKISSNALLSNSAQNSAQVVTRIFAVSKIVEIASVNIFRIDKTWDLISDHLRLICNHKNQSIRSIGVDSLTTLITSAFAHESSIKSDSNVTSGPDMQKPFLETLEELSRSSFSDTRLKTLQSLFHILQSSGQSFSKAWPLVLSILMTIAVNNDKAHIPTAFKSVQLICTDFLSNLPLDCLALYITTIGTYAVQGSDINISLTAIGLLWNIADFVAKENPTLTTSSKTSAPQAPRKIGTLSPQDKLWLSAFTEMKQLCSDPRPEVRNCALVTLFKTLTTHGVLLNYGAWAACLSDILFPLLNDVKTASATASSTDSGSNYELGKNGGKSVYMIVHHSRNNAQKQWEETVTIAIGGIVKVFKSYLQTLCDLPDFISSWKTLLDYLESFIESGSREVAVSTIQLLQDFVLANASNTKFTSSLAEPTWEMFERIAFSLTKNAQKKSAMSAILTLAELIKSIVHLSIDTNRLLRILRILGLYHSPDPQHENVDVFSTTPHSQS